MSARMLRTTIDTGLMNNVEELALAFDKNPFATTVDIHATKFASRRTQPSEYWDLEKTLKVLEDKSYVISLSFVYNQLTTEQLSQICDFLTNRFSARSTLKTLSITFNDLRGAGRAFAKLLASKQLTSLEQLRIGHTQLGCGDFGVIAQELHNLKRLSRLFLGSNSLGDNGLLFLVQALERFREPLLLKTLELSANDITDMGLRYLAQRILFPNKAPVLECLDLGCNALTKQSVFSLCKAIPKLLYLTLLDLDGNIWINGEAIDELVRVSRGHRALTSIWVEKGVGTGRTSASGLKLLALKACLEANNSQRARIITAILSSKVSEFGSQRGRSQLCFIGMLPVELFQKLDGFVFSQ